MQPCRICEVKTENKELSTTHKSLPSGHFLLFLSVVLKVEVELDGALVAEKPVVGSLA